MSHPEGTLKGIEVPKMRKDGGHWFSMTNLIEIPVSPKPFLRWAGGKRKLASMIAGIFPDEFNGLKNTFFEPFIGGGAVAFHLGDRRLRQYVPGQNLVINDINPDLVCTYEVVRDALEDLIKYLKKISTSTDLQSFEEMRSYKPRNEIERAGRFIYLNKTCFNGLWRVNSKGQFNVPWGKLKKPKIFDEVELRCVSQRLNGTKIRNTNFVSAVSDIKRGDLVYLDPPYIPLSASSSFSKYAKDDFGILDQYALAGLIEGLNRLGAYVILSNSDTELSRKIYGEVLNLRQIKVQRNISASANSRVSVNEIIGVNFQISKVSDLSKLKVV